jgi:hypothetical protein
MRVVQDAVADRVGEHRIRKVVVPLGRQLARDDGRAIAVAVLEDLEEVPALLVCERRQAPIVNQQDVDAREFAEDTDVGAIGAGEGEVVKEARRPAIVRSATRRFSRPFSSSSWRSRRTSATSRPPYFAFPIERLLAKAVSPAQVQRLGARRRLLQHADDLLFGEPLALHAAPSRRAS